MGGCVVGCCKTFHKITAITTYIDEPEDNNDDNKLLCTRDQRTAYEQSTEINHNHQEYWLRKKRQTKTLRTGWLAGWLTD